MDNAIKYANFIKRIFTTSSPIIRKKLLNSSNNNIIRAISEILLNVYSKNFIISKSALKMMKKSKRDLLKVINKRTSYPVRKQLIIRNSEHLLGLREVFK